MRPVILLTCSGMRTESYTSPLPDTEFKFAGPATPCKADADPHHHSRGCLKTLYFQAVEAAGGAPLLLPNTPDADNARAATAVADGLLLTGGWDIDPRHYGQPPHETVVRIDSVRDTTELAAIEVALQRRIPIFAICRGIQVLNVALGGTLVQDIPACWRSNGHPVVHRGQSHEITIEAGTALADLWGGRITVNSRHHQCLDRVADRLRVTARSDDGVIEAAESTDGLMLAVQSHPEDLWQADRVYLRPFEWLVQRSKREVRGEKREG